MNGCAGSEVALLLQPVAPVALGALSDADQCKSLATKGLFAKGFLQALHQLKDDKPACFTLCAATLIEFLPVLGYSIKAATLIEFLPVWVQCMTYNCYACCIAWSFA